MGPAREIRPNGRLNLQVTGVDRGRAELFFDAEELVVFRDPIAAGSRAGFDLAGIGRDGDIGDGDILGLTGTVGDDGGVVILVGEFDGVEGLGEGADLVDLHEDRIGGAGCDTLFEEVDVGDEEIVAHELNFVAEGDGEFFPGGPVVLVATVFDRVDGVFGDEVLVVGHELIAREFLAGGLFEDVFILLFIVELGGSDVEGEHDVFAELVTGGLDGGGDGIEGIGGGREIGSKATFVAHGGRETLSLQHLLEGVEDFGAGAEGFREGPEVHGTNHELLEIDGCVGVSAAVHDVHHGNGQNFGVGATEILVERQAQAIGGSVGGGERHPENGIGAKVRLVFGAVEFEHRGIHADLVAGIEADQSGGDVALDVADSGLHAFAEVATFGGLGFRAAQALYVAVAEFVSFVLTGRGAGRNRGAADGAVGEFDVDLNGRVAAGIDDFASVNSSNRGIHERVEMGLMSSDTGRRGVKRTRLGEGSPKTPSLEDGVKLSLGDSGLGSAVSPRTGGG